MHLPIKCEPTVHVLESCRVALFLCTIPCCDANLLLSISKILRYSIRDYQRLEYLSTVEHAYKSKVWAQRSCSYKHVAHIAVACVLKPPTNFWMGISPLLWSLTSMILKTKHFSGIARDIAVTCHLQGFWEGNKNRGPLKWLQSKKVHDSQGETGDHQGFWEAATTDNTAGGSQQVGH